MTTVKVSEADNILLWQVLFRPFEDEQQKEAARAELRRRGQMGEPIEAREA